MFVVSRFDFVVKIQDLFFKVIHNLHKMNNQILQKVQFLKSLTF